MEEFHVYFCPLFRYNYDIFSYIGFEDRFRELVVEKSLEHGMEVLGIDCWSTYVHVHASGEDMSDVAEYILDLKSYTSETLLSEYPQLRKFPQLWISSYLLTGTDVSASDVLDWYLKTMGSDKSFK